MAETSKKLKIDIDIEGQRATKYMAIERATQYHKQVTDIEQSTLPEKEKDSLVNSITHSYISADFGHLIAVLNKSGNSSPFRHAEFTLSVIIKKDEQASYKISKKKKE